MIKVLMIGPDRSVHGGISGVINNYYEAGLHHKIDLCYIGTMIEGPKGVKLLQALKAWLHFLVKLPAYDIVHVNMASDSSYYRKSIFIRTAYLFHKKIVIHQHGGDFKKFYHTDMKHKGRQNVKKVLSMGNVFLVLGKAWKAFFGTIIDTDNIIVLPNSIQIPERQNKRYGVRHILFLGRLCKAKGIGELLDVMPVLLEKYPDVHLYLGGIWEDMELKEKAEALSFCVTDLGWLTGEEKKKYLQECDIFVLPSYFEGQPVSILEAMTYSCGIVATKTGSVPEMIIENETGLFVLPQDTKTLQESLDRLLGNPELCRELGENARKKVETEFSIEDNIKRLLGIYESLVMKKDN